MELIQLLKYVLMTETVNPSEGSDLWYLLELILLSAEPLHQLWTALKRREWMEKAFAVVIFGVPVFLVMMVQTIFMEGFFFHKHLLQYWETRAILGQSALYQEVILINVITIFLILLCFGITIRQNKDWRKHKFIGFLSIGGLEFVLAIFMIGFSYYILKENPWFLFEQNPEVALAYLYIGWHMVLKSVMLMGIILFSLLFYRKEQGEYGNEMDASAYLEEHIRQQGRFMAIASGIYLFMQLPVDVMVVKETWRGFPIGEEIMEIVFYIVTMSIINIFFLVVTVVLLGVFYINMKRWIKPKSDKVFTAMASWGNTAYITQILCRERYKSKERIFKSRGYEVTEHFIYRPCLFWKYDLFYLKQIKSVTQAVGMDGVYTILTFQDGKKFKAYHMQTDVIAHIKQFLPQEEIRWN